MVWRQKLGTVSQVSIEMLPEAPRMASFPGERVQREEMASPAPCKASGPKSVAHIKTKKKRLRLIELMDTVDLAESRVSESGGRKH